MPLISLPDLAELPASHHQNVTHEEEETIHLIYSRKPSCLLNASTVLVNWLKDACIYCLYWGKSGAVAFHHSSACPTPVDRSIVSFIKQLGAACRKQVCNTANCWRCLLPDPSTQGIKATCLMHDGQRCMYNSDILLVSMAAVWALPNAPLQSAITNNQPFSTADQVCSLISQTIPFGPQLKQGLSASLPVLISTIIIMAPVPESVMSEVNAVIVPSNERMEYTPDGRPCVRFPTMIHRIGLSARTLVSSPIAPPPVPHNATPQSHLIQPNRAIASSPSVPSSSHTAHSLPTSGHRTLPIYKARPSRLLEVPTPISTPKPKTPVAVDRFLTPPNPQTSSHKPPPFRKPSNNLLHMPLSGSALSKRKLADIEDHGGETPSKRQKRLRQML